MKSTRPGPRLRLAGKHRTTSKPALPAPSTGIWRIEPGGRAYVPPATPVNDWGQRHEGDSPRRRRRPPVAPDAPGGVKATAAGLRQADGLLSAVDPDAGRH